MSSYKVAATKMRLQLTYPPDVTHGTASRSDSTGQHDLMKVMAHGKENEPNTACNPPPTMQPVGPFEMKIGKNKVRRNIANTITHNRETKGTHIRRQLLMNEERNTQRKNENPSRRNKRVR